MWLVILDGQTFPKSVLLVAKTVGCCSLLSFFLGRFFAIENFLRAFLVEQPTANIGTLQMSRRGREEREIDEAEELDIWDKLEKAESGQVTLTQTDAREINELLTSLMVQGVEKSREDVEFSIQDLLESVSDKRFVNYLTSHYTNLGADEHHVAELKRRKSTILQRRQSRATTSDEGTVEVS